MSGALLYVYINESTTELATIYTNEGLSTPSTNPAVANTSGQFPSVWAEAGTELDPTLYRVAVTRADGSSPGNAFVFDNYRPSVDFDTATAALAEAAAASAQADRIYVQDAIDTALEVGGGSAALAGALAGTTAGTAAANAVVAGKANIDLQNANLPDGGWLKAGAANLLRRQVNGFLEPALPIQRDTSGQFIDRQSLLMTGLRYVVSPGSVVPQIHIINDVLGNNTTFQGATAIYAKSQSNSAEVTGTKGVLYCFTADVAPKLDRNNFPFDDATPYVVSNSGTGRATEFFYAGRNPALPYDSHSLLGSDANHFYGLQVAGKVDYPVELGNGAGIGAVYLSAIRGSQNTTFISAWNAARTVTIPHFAVDASDRSVIDGKVVKPWAAYTPTVTPGTGSYASPATVSGRTSRINNTVEDVVIVTLPNPLGTASNGITISLSATPASGAYGVAAGVLTTTNVSVKAIILPSTGTVNFTRYDGADINAAGNSFIFTMRYEAA